MICQTEQDVLSVVKETEVSFIQFWFTDVLGILKSFAVTPSELEEGVIEGMGFDGSSSEEGNFVKYVRADTYVFHKHPQIVQYHPRPNNFLIVLQSAQDLFSQGFPVDVSLLMVCTLTHLL